MIENYNYNNNSRDKVVMETLVKVGMQPEFSIAEVQKHNLPTDCWIVVHNNIYDISNFVPFHPGGLLILSCAGADATVMFHQYHTPSVINSRLMQQLKKFHIGRVTNHSSPLLGDVFEVLSCRVEEELRGSPRHPFLGLMMFFFDVLFYLGICFVVFYLWWADVTDTLAVVSTLFLVDLFATRVAGQGHAVGHMQVFGKSHVEKADKLMLILSRSYLLYSLPSMAGPHRHKLSQKRVVSQDEFSVGRGKYICNALIYLL
jgi:cytochrome b involved in lipid metabolism